MDCAPETVLYIMIRIVTSALLSPARTFRNVRLCTAALSLVALAASAIAQAADRPRDNLLRISRPAHPDQLIAVPGQRSTLLGRESGRFEAWAWPLKILHDFHLSVRIDGQILIGDSLVRSVTVRPGSTTLVYAGSILSQPSFCRATIQRFGLAPRIAIQPRVNVATA